MSHPIRARSLWVVAGACALLAAALFVNVRRLPVRAPVSPLTLPARGPLTIAATGDSLIVHPLAAAPRDAALASAFDAIRGANLALTNLDENLLTGRTARSAQARAGGGWPYGSETTAQQLKDIGFDVIALANNHGTDYGAEGLTDTAQILRDAGLLPVGTGWNLGQARAPALAGGGPRRIAIIAVASSATAESRATATRLEIKGRPGINPLRYAANITADPKTFQSLQEALPALGSDPGSAMQLSFFGTSVKRGDHTSVELVLDERDTRDVLGEIARARAEAEIVVVSVHSHEPTNDSDTPAGFLRDFAHAAIDAGAHLVVGHGPHRLRGIELYKRGAILYSLGNFLYQTQGLDFRTADAYDAGVDLFRLALGAVGEHEAVPTFGLHSSEWWQSVIAVAAFDEGQLTSIRLEPIDLGVDLPADSRGLPRIAEPVRSAAILDRLNRLSQPYGTRLQVEGHTGVIRVP
jgi:poly-gamma-glutamate synthesis protein (capsule biosynthesis protein)